jgi:hypothetical protein
VAADDERRVVVEVARVKSKRSDPRDDDLFDLFIQQVSSIRK